MSGASQDDQSLFDNTINKLDFQKMQSDETLNNSPRKSPPIVQMMNALSSKSAKSPITLVKDNRLFGYTPRRENVTDFLPKKIKIPIPPSMRPDETYPMPTAWNQE